MTRPTEQRLERACPGCGFKRRVRVWLNEDGSDRYNPPLCNICETKARAYTHECWAKKLRKRADEMLGRRLAKQAKKGASDSK